MRELSIRCTGGNNMKKCPYCGFEVEDDVYHCPKCKAAIPHEEKTEPEPVRGSKRKNKE